MKPELRQRIITAVILLPMVVWCVFFAPDTSAFASFAGAVVLVAAWEWTAMMGWQGQVARGSYVVLVTTLVIASRLPQLQPLNASIFMLATAFWLVALRLVLSYPRTASLWARPVVLAPLGLLLLVPAWMGLTLLHAESAFWLMYLFLLVWGADTGAYFAGRAFGRRKLAPDVSPGKTLEGFAGGLLLTMALALAVGFYRELAGLRFVAFLGLSLLTVLASVLGDLFESMVKRNAGIKDSGTIFPGHGGALDRIDSLTAAAPVFALGWLLAGGF